MHTVLLSVIMPVFNTDSYLRNCIESVLSQSLKEIELIIVNDGSTDTSSQIIEEYALVDSRIRVINKDNEGQGVARNMAMQIAKGKYLGFIDSDDWAKPSMYEELYNVAVDNDADVVICDYVDEKSDLIFTTKDFAADLTLSNIHDCFLFDLKSQTEYLFKINSSPWNKIYRREYIVDNNITFAENIYYQDVVFVYDAIICSKKTVFYCKDLYVYRAVRPFSTTSDSGKRHFDIFIALSQLNNRITTRGYQDFLKYHFARYVLGQYLYHYREIDGALKFEFWSKASAELSKLDDDVIKDLMEFEPNFKRIRESGIIFYNYLPEILNSETLLLNKAIKILGGENDDIQYSANFSNYDVTALLYERLFIAFQNDNNNIIKSVGVEERTLMVIFIQLLFHNHVTHKHIQEANIDLRNELSKRVSFVLRVKRNIKDLFNFLKN